VTHSLLAVFTKTEFLYIQLGEGIQTMPISIRNPRVDELARDLAAKRNMTMTEVIIQALEKEAKVEKTERLRDVNRRIADDFKSKGLPTGHRMSKDEIDRMWGHE
jgi:hypothetical protein